MPDEFFAPVDHLYQPFSVLGRPGMDAVLALVT